MDADLLTNRFAATLPAVIIAGWLLMGGGSKSLWPIFASSNQLLAALTLLGCTLWLLRNKRPAIITLLPMLFMTVTSGAAIATLFYRNLKQWIENGFNAGGVMTLATGILILMATALILLGVASLKHSIKKLSRT